MSLDKVINKSLFSLKCISFLRFIKRMILFASWFTGTTFMSLPFKGLKCGERLIKHVGILLCYVIRTADIHIGIKLCLLF